jgi:oligoribonuclease
MKTAKILWVDLEMTGLDAQKDVILEVAAIATDWDFKEIATFETVIHHPDTVLDTMNQWCIDQHGASGLTERVRESTTSQQQAETEVLAFIDEHFDTSVPVLLADLS